MSRGIQGIIRRGTTVATVLFLHGWNSKPGGVKPTYLAQHGHTVINPALPDEDFAESVRIAQEAFYEHRPEVVVGSSRGGAVAMNLFADRAGLVLLCPAWKKWGYAKIVMPGTVILHSEADDVVPIADSRELLARSGQPESALIVVGDDHRLADPEPLAAMLDAVEKAI
jgi:alpha-beta hydrolase superfamily lysophospholipase